MIKRPWNFGFGAFLWSNAGSGFGFGFRFRVMGGVKSSKLRFKIKITHNQKNTLHFPNTL